MHCISHHLCVYLTVGSWSKTKPSNQRLSFIMESLERGLNRILYFYIMSLSLPPSLLSLSFSLPHTQTHTHSFFTCSLLKAPDDIPSVSECWSLFAQWTRWLRKRSKHYYHIISGVIRTLFGAHAALRGLGSVLERHSFSDRAFIYLQYIVPSFPHASPLSRGLSKPSVDASAAERVRCSSEQKGK